MRELFAFYHSSNASRVINNTPEIKYPSSYLLPASTTFQQLPEKGKKNSYGIVIIFYQNG